MFTFREDQKDRVSPNYQMPPKVVYVPQYNEELHREWNCYYNCPDLEPVDYMEGSASKVMRKKQYTPEEMRQRHMQQFAQQMHPQGGAYYPGYGPGNVPQGYQQMMQQRADMNRAQMAQENGRVYIGEPGTGPGMRQYANNTNIGRKTVVGEPRNHWQNTQPNEWAVPRPGDYNYTQPSQRTYAEGYPEGGKYGNGHSTGHTQAHTYSGQGQGHETTRSPMMPGNLPPVANPSMYEEYNNNGEVTKYRVQTGDTLSTISDQPAIYNNWQMWPLLYDANKNIIPDPDMVRPNQHLDVPRNYTPTDAEKARNRAKSKRPPVDLYDGR